MRRILIILVLVHLGSPSFYYGTRIAEANSGIVTPGSQNDSPKKEKKEEVKSDYYRGILSEEDKKYAAELSAKLKAARMAEGILTEDEKAEAEEKANLAKDKYHVFLGMEAPKMDKVYEYAMKYKKAHPEIHLVVHLLHHPEAMADMTAKSETEGLMLKQYPLTAEFLKLVSLYEDGFPFLPETSIAKKFGVSYVPSFGYQEASKQRRFVWTGMPNMDLAKSSALTRTKGMEDQDALIEMGVVGPSIPINIGKIDETTRMLTKMFDINNLVKMYEVMKQMDHKVFEDLALDVKKFYAHNDFFKPEIPEVRNKFEQFTDDKLPLNTVMAPNKRLFFFSADSPQDISTARAIGTDGYGFCVQWSSAAQVAQFRQSVGHDFMFMVCSDNSIYTQYELKSFPAIFYVNEDYKTYTVEYGR